MVVGYDCGCVTCLPLCGGEKGGLHVVWCKTNRVPPYSASQSLESVRISITEVEVLSFQIVEVGVGMLVLCRASHNPAFLRLTKRVRASAPT
jgi:hypothetical protein